jgi:thioredoxin 1
MSSDDELEIIMQRKMAELQKAALKPIVTPLIEPIVLTDSNFNGEITKYPLILVDFWAPWCGPCRTVSPIIEQLARTYSGKVTFGKINVDENRMIPASFGIQSIPTMMIFKNGRAIDVIIGALPKAQIEMKLKKQLAPG